MIKKFISWLLGVVFWIGVGVLIGVFCI